jgi:Leucine-rich repeat (LRR) protein
MTTLLDTFFKWKDNIINPFRHGPATKIAVEDIRESTRTKDPLLYITNSYLTSLPPIPTHVDFLGLNNTKISKLPLLHDTLETLVCVNTPLIEIQSLPAKLLYLDCSNTLLKSLPPLPDTLRQLFCNDTPIETLPLLPPKLHELNCSNTKLTSLPELPPYLQLLDISYTKIEDLPNIPESLHFLICRNTPLKLPMKPYETVKEYRKRWVAWKQSTSS